MPKKSTLKTRTINIEELKPAEYNPRVMPPSEQLKLKNGLETFGLVDPIIIDLTDENTVIGGHQRLEVLKEIDDEQELTLIPLGDIGLVIRETDLKIKDKNDQKALNLALNKIQGDWDYSKLDDLLLELSDDHYQIELTGFDEQDITLDTDFDYSDLFDDLEEDEEEEIPDDLQEVQGEQPNHQVVVHLAFPSHDEANKFLKQIGITRELDKSSGSFIFGDDFNFLTE